MFSITVFILAGFSSFPEHLKHSHAPPPIPGYQLGSGPRLRVELEDSRWAEANSVQSIKQRVRPELH